MYVGFTFKGKMSIEEESDTGRKVLVATPKSAEVSSLKILDKNGEESIVEQMVFTSFMNLQLDSFIGKLSPERLPFKSIETPTELKCFGIELTEIYAEFKKEFIEIG